MSQQETVALPEVAPPVDRNLWLFGLMWFGQLISGIGSGLTTFAMGVWVYQQTGSAARFTFIALLSALPSLAMMPVAGALVDRWDKRWTMILSNCASALCVLAMLLVALNGRLDIWHIYLCVLALSVSGTLQGLAYYPAITLCVPKRLLGRVSGMTHASQATTQIAAPMLGGLMIAAMGIQTIFLVDFVTYLFGIVTLLIVRIPELAKREAGGGRSSLLKEALYGWTYVRERTSLLLLMLYFASTNFLLTMALVLLAPMVLSFTTPQWLGTLNSVSGVGLLAGSLAMTTWGGPKDRVRGVLGFGLLVAASLACIGLRPNPLLIAPALFALYFSIPLVNGSSQALWQCKTAPEVQGRVFALRRMVASSLAPVSFFLAGPLADRWFEPLLAEGGGLSGSVGRVLGVGPGRGMALVFVLAGCLTVIIQALAFRLPSLRLAESLLPDAIPD
ncbi:MAG TPA: MFS transporter [Pyrinomonadaceae bacterium]|jgi:MFS family permease